MLKGAGLLLFALFIDGLQAMISLTLFGVLSGVSLIPFIGVAISATAGPIGVILGTVVSICISITMGGGLIAALALNGMFYPSKLIPAFAELIPGLNNGPLWTVVVVRSMMQKYKEEHGKSFFKRKSRAAAQEVSLAGAARTNTAPPSRTSPNRQAGSAAPMPRQEGRAPMPALKSLDGIRRPTPANDNMPLQRPAYVQKAA
ncbi:MAG: hypothetical protein KA066_01190 [Candidatus Pacebacteria bacterium]|nr:hypothetical protein [Candidatus Paceibacterota bacterium]